MELLKRSRDADLVRVVGAAHVDGATAVREVAQALRAKQAAGHRLARQTCNRVGRRKDRDRTGGQDGSR